MKVLMTGIFYPMAMLRYFERAFIEEFGKSVDFRTAGFYTGNWIAWNNGMTVPERYAVPPTYGIYSKGQFRNLRWVELENLMGDWRPDLVIQVDAGMHVSDVPKNIKNFLVMTDPHVLPYPYRDRFDRVFNMQANYLKRGEVYLPYAYLPSAHYPSEDTAKTVDAILVGLHYPQRVAWVRRLTQLGVSVRFSIGEIWDEYRALHHKARIGLNWSSLQDLTARAFELPAMKLAPVMNFLPNTVDIFPSDTYAGFSSLEEAVENVVYLKNHPAELDALAERAYQNVLPHTYNKRVHTIMEYYE